MSSARKRAAIQKANNEADNLRQRLMLAEHHANVMRGMAEVIAIRHDSMRAALVSVRQYPGIVEYVGTQIMDAVDEALKVGVGDTAAMGSNVELRGGPAVSSPERPA